MAGDRTINMRVTRAGYKYIGHYRRGSLEIVLEGSSCGVSINPQNEFSLYDLFLCFGVDPENGKWLNELIGKYCRVILDEDGYVRMIQHIVNDKLWWSDGKGAEK